MMPAQIRNGLFGCLRDGGGNQIALAERVGFIGRSETVSHGTKVHRILGR
jgi:hypothetical protein